jgi:putative MFS transporter
MLSLFHFLQAFALYGYISWMPTFLVTQGISVTKSLGYTLGMALVAPFGGLLCMSFADKFERKWQIVGSALAIAAVGIVFANSRNPWIIVPAGGFELLSAAVLSFNFHAYQAELFPTRFACWRSASFIPGAGGARSSPRWWSAGCWESTALRRSS